MRLFIDTGSVAEVEEIAAWGVLSGATTNPSLLAKEEGDPGRRSSAASASSSTAPSSAEVVVARRRRDGRRGPRAARRCTSTSSSRCRSRRPACRRRAQLTAEGHPGQHDARLLADQALLTAEAGATYVSCFMGRLDDISIDSAAVVARDRRGAPRRAAYTGAGPGGVDPPPRARRDRRAARLRGRDGAGARCCAQMLDHPLTTAGHREVRRPTGESRPEFARVAAGPRRRHDRPRVER